MSKWIVDILLLREIFVLFSFLHLYWSHSSQCLYLNMWIFLGKNCKVTQSYFCTQWWTKTELQFILGLFFVANEYFGNSGIQLEFKCWQFHLRTLYLRRHLLVHQTFRTYCQSNSSAIFIISMAHILHLVFGVWSYISNPGRRQQIKLC